MKKQLQNGRLERGNKMLAALETETHRGRACVGDAMIDELFKTLFAKRLIDQKKEVADVLLDGQPLGNHGVRLKLAFLLGWIGPETYADCRNIHKIRNKMAHQLDVDTFEHEQVRDLVDRLQASRQVLVNVDGTHKRLNLKRRDDRFRYAVMTAVMRCWWLIDHSAHSARASDVPIVPLPKSQADVRRSSTS